MPKKTTDPEMNLNLESGAPQTDPEMEEFMAGDVEIPAPSDELPQTDPENPADPAADSFQTDPESPLDLDSGSSPQTDIDSLVSTPENQPDTNISSQSDSGEGEPDPDPQPEIKPAPKQRRSRKKASDDSQSEDDNNDSPPTESESAAKPARRRRRSTPIVSIDEQRSVETDADKLRNDLLDLVESLKGKKILTGTIQGIERSADNPNISFAVIYHGEFKVIIPADETVDPPDDFRDRLPGDVMHYLVTKRLGAEIDFIVKGVDQQTGIAAASRLDAMAKKRKDYYFGTDRDGNNLLYEGSSAEARIVSVIRAGIFVDLFGLEVYIPLRELSYQRWIDAAQHFQAGQRVLVKVLTLDRSDRNNIQVTASVKQAGENPYEKALRRYTVGSRYVGTVSMVDTNGVFVSLDGGIDCLCSYPKRGRPPRGARVTVRILGINNDTNRIWGAITHMTTAR